MRNPFSAWVGRKVDPRPAHATESAQAEPLVFTPMPSLVSILLRLEEEKGAPLTEAEVIHARDNAACVALPAKEAAAVATARGYPDIDIEAAWPAWLAFKQQTGG